jgi:hypothetical protein
VTTASLQRKWRQWRRRHVRSFSGVMFKILLSTLSACCCRGQAAHGAGGAHRNEVEEADERAAAGAGNSGESRGSARVDNNQPKSSSNSSGNGAGGGGDSDSHGSGNGSGNGDGGNGGNGGNNAAAMAAITAAPTWRRQWQRGWLMWAEVIFHSTYYYLHDSMYRCDNNCQGYGKTQKCFDSKHICVLMERHICVFQNTFVFCKTHLCFLCGACLFITLLEGH